MPWWEFSWSPFGRYTTWGASREGKKDGMAGQPPWDAPSAPYAVSLAEVAESCIRGVIEQWSKIDETLAEKQARAEKFRDRINEETQNVKKTLDELEGKYKEKFGNLPPDIGFGHFLVYWLVLVVIGICELPLNAVAFRIMGESEIFTYIVTGTLAVGIPLAAHFTGVFLKEANEDKSKLYWAIVCIVSVMMVVVVVAIIRQQYIARFTEEQGIAKLAWLFVFINFFIFAVASIYSYWMHNPLLSQVLKIRKKYNNLRKMLERAIGEVEAIKQKRKSIRNVYEARARSYKDSAQRLMQTYYQYNMRYRPKNEERHTPLPAWAEQANQPKIRIDFPPLPFES